MGITIDPSFVPAPPVEVVTSPDGILSAKVDASHGSVLLWANYAGSPEQVLRTNYATNPGMRATTGTVTVATYDGPYDGTEPFSGDTPDDDTFTYSWTGTAGASTSVKTAREIAGWRRPLYQGGNSKAVFYNPLVVSSTNTDQFGVAGEFYSVRFKVQALTPDDVGKEGQYQIYDGATLSGVLDFTVTAEPTEVTQTSPRSLTAPGGLYLYPGTTVSGFVITDLLIEKVDGPGVQPGPYFDGGDQGTNPAYRWTGAVDGSTSQEFIPAVAPHDPLPQKVRFYRGDGTLVRSGDPAWAPGGVAVAYDHESAIGSTASYYAVPLGADGAAGTPTDTLAVQVPNLSGVRDVWIKSPGRPDLSRLAWVENPPEITRAARTTFTDVQGSRLGVASWDVRTGQQMTLTIVTDTIAEAGVLEALLDVGPLLVQTRVEYDLPGFYCLPGDVTRVRVGRMGEPTSRWEVPLTECPRPATLDAPLRIPGLTWDSLPPQYATWDELAAQVGSWAELLGVEL